MQVYSSLSKPSNLSTSSRVLRFSYLPSKISPETRLFKEAGLRISFQSCRGPNLDKLNKSGEIISKTGDLIEGQQIILALADGSAKATVDDIGKGDKNE